MNMNTFTSPWGYLHEGEDIIPDDCEDVDRVSLALMINKYFSANYPDFEPQIVSTFDKQYFLPALKVLSLVDGEYYSPGYTAKWENMELMAECRNENSFSSAYRNGRIYDFANGEFVSADRKHIAPNENCDCGIYGSVNIEEVAGILGTLSKSQFGYPSKNTKPLVLCIIEPSPNAKVFICRKGWRASHAFISEIVAETLSIQEASQLLSVAWQRNIDARRIYENW